MAYFWIFFLFSCSWTFNIFTTCVIGAYANCSGVNLDNLDLSNMDLTGIDFSHSDIQYVNFSNSILEFADFSGSDLDYVDLYLIHSPHAKTKRFRI